MIPTGLFRSRWAALFWAAGIVWTAYDIAGATPEHAANDAAAATAPRDAVGDRVDPAALATLANASPS